MRQFYDFFRKSWLRKSPHFASQICQLFASYFTKAKAQTMEAFVSAAEEEQNWTRVDDISKVISKLF